MGRVIADAMHATGMEEVLVVGGSPDIAESLGCSFVADLYPGEGPLGGLITAMRAVSSEILCVLPCDVPLVTSDRIQQLVSAVEDLTFNDASVLTSLREHWLCSSWRVSRCLPMLEKSFIDGERDRSVGQLRPRICDAEFLMIRLA